MIIQKVDLFSLIVFTIVPVKVILIHSIFLNKKKFFCKGSSQIATIYMIGIMLTM